MGHKFDDTLARTVVVHATDKLRMLGCTQQYDDFLLLISRGMNTWEDAPKWLHELYDELQGNGKLIHKP